MTELMRIPNSIAVGAQVSFGMSTAKNPSESGNSSRKSLRPIKRNYMVSISPTDAEEMQAIIMAAMGDRYPMAMRDYSSYKVEDEECLYDADSGYFLLGRTWAPATGTLSRFERILVPDDLAFSINGSPPTSGGITYHDFGRISYGGMAPSDEVLITGTYLKAVCMVDNPSLDLITLVGGETVMQFTQMRLEEIFEAELLELVA